MEFRFEDILKNIIPGIITLVSIGFYFLGDHTFIQMDNLLASNLKEYPELIITAILVGSYLIGYIIDGVSSLLEHYFIHRIFGSPTYKLLRGKGHRITLVNSEEILSNICSKFPENKNLRFTGKWNHDKATAILLFKHANILKLKANSKEHLELIKEYYYSYIFSRNVFFSGVLSIALIICKFYESLTFVGYICLGIVLAILFIRRRDRSYYYSRQVLIASNSNSD